MTVIAIFPALLCLIGLVVWALCDAPAPAGSPRLARVAWVCFVVGLAVFTYVLAGWVIKV